SLGRRDCLGRIEAERGELGDVPNPRAPIGRRESMRCIFNYVKPVPVRDPLHRLEIAWLAGNVYRYDGSSFGCDSAPGVFGIDIKAAGQAVTQNWTRIEVNHHCGSRREGIRRQQDFVPGLQSDGIESQLQS